MYPDNDELDNELASGIPESESENKEQFEKTDEQVILEYLKENGSPKLHERMEVENGESYCVSYILKQVQGGKSVPVALGWLEQELEA